GRPLRIVDAGYRGTQLRTFAGSAVANAAARESQRADRAGAHRWRLAREWRAREIASDWTGHRADHEGTRATRVGVGLHRPESLRGPANVESQRQARARCSRE